MFISDLNHIEGVESNKVMGGGGGYGWFDNYFDNYDNDCGDRKFKNVAVAVAAAGDRNSCCH